MRCPEPITSSVCQEAVKTRYPNRRSSPSSHSCFPRRLCPNRKPHHIGPTLLAPPELGDHLFTAQPRCSQLVASRSPMVPHLPRRNEGHTMFICRTPRSCSAARAHQVSAPMAVGEPQP